MAKIEVKSDDVLNSVFGGSEDPENFKELTKTEYKDAQGNDVLPTPDDSWIARVASMSLSIKVTPKVGDIYVSVENGMVIDLNGKQPKEVVSKVWADLQKQVVEREFSSLSKAIEELNKVKSK